MSAAVIGLVRRRWREPARWILALFVVIAGVVLPATTSAQRRTSSRRAAPALASRSAVRSSATSATGASARGGARSLAEPSRAPRRDAPFPIGLELAAATSAPLTVGVEATLELPLGLLLRGHVGFVPEPYVGLLNDVVNGLGGYDDSIAQIVDRAGSNALIVRASAGIRPVPGYGFEIVAGYTHIASSARITAADFEDATGQSMRWPGLDDVGIDSQLHMLHVQFGWTALVWDHLAIRVLVGWAHTLAASSQLDVPAELRARAPARFADIEHDVEDALTSHGFTPELSLAVGYRF